MTAPRIALSGVLRTWDAAERTGVNGSYVRSVLGAGGVPIILSPLLDTSLVARALEGIDGVVLTGGEDIHPGLYGAEPSPHLYPPSRERDLFELELFAEARRRALPILGICRGIQLVNVGLGGTLFQDLPSERPSSVAHDPGGARQARTHEVRLEPGSRAAQALGRTRVAVNSFHHQAIDRLASGLVATGWTEDNLIEAVESEDRSTWLLAVQWHPEEMHADMAAPERGLFRALVGAAASRGSAEAAGGASARRAPGESGPTSTRSETAVGR